MVGVDGEEGLGADLLADDPQAVSVLGHQGAAHLGLEAAVALGEGLATEAAPLLLAVSGPADAGGVGGVAVGAENGLSFG